MISLLYVSTKSTSITEQDISMIVESSSVNNAELEITGVLLEYNNCFLQYLEGPEYNVLRLYDTIKRDNRHSNIQLIQNKYIQERIFSDWSMILKDFSDLSEEIQGNGVVYSKKEFRNYVDNNEFWNKVDMFEYLSNLI